MSETETASANRWIPFQCPSCSGLFRIRKSQVGLTGRCPMCGAAVQPSGKENPGILEQAASPAVSDGNLLEKVALAKEMTPEEIEQRRASRKSHRRQHLGGEGEKIEWEDESNGASKEISWKVVVSIVLSALVLLALGIFYYQRSGPSVIAGSDAPPIDREKTDALLDEIEEAQRNTKKIEEGDVAAKTVDEFKKFDDVKMEEAIENFVTAKSPNELKKYVRDPERVGPKIDRYYEKVEYEAPGFESLNKLEISYRGELLTTMVTTADFLLSPIAIERVVDGESEKYLVDWESWVGYSDYTPEEMRSKKPVKPFLIRAIVENASYYNYGFTDDRKWRSLGLELKDPTYSFLGYVERDSEQDKRLRVMMKNTQGIPCLLKVAYPAGSRAVDQLEILEIVTEGWVIGAEEMENDDE